MLLSTLQIDILEFLKLYDVGIVEVSNHLQAWNNGNMHVPLILWVLTFFYVQHIKTGQMQYFMQ